MTCLFKKMQDFMQKCKSLICKLSEKKKKKEINTTEKTNFYQHDKIKFSSVEHLI